MKVILISICFALTFSSLNAQVYKTESILRKHAKAMGGRNLLKNYTSLYYEAKIDSRGLAGQYKAWILPADRIRTEMKLGVINEANCYNGKQQWTISLSDGTTSVGDELSKKEMFSLALLQSRAYVFADTTIRVRYLTREGEMGRSFLVMQVSPSSGVDFKIWVDEQTWLLAKSEISSGGFTTIREYDAYASVNGLMLPYFIKVSVPQLQQEYTLNLYNVKLNSYVDERLFVLQQNVKHKYILSRGNKSAPMKFNLNGGIVTVKGMINGQGPYVFALDCAMEASVVSEYLATKLHMDSAGFFNAQGPNSILGSPMVKVDSLNLDGAAFYGQIMVTRPAEEILARYAGIKVDFILGYDFFSQFVVGLNFSQNALTLYKPEGFAAPAGYSFVSCNYDDLVPVLRVFPLETSGKFIVSTASPTTIDFTEPFVKSSGLKKNLKRLVESGLHPYSDAVDMMVGRIKIASLGPFEFLDIPVGIAQNAKYGIYASHKYDGIVGTEILRRFDLMFDYKGNRIAMKKNHLFEDKFKTEKSGMKLKVRENGNIIVAGNVAGSPADEAMIEPGSLLLELNGKDVSRLGMRGIREILSGPKDNEVTVKTSKNGKTHTATLILRIYY